MNYQRTHGRLCDWERLLSITDVAEVMEVHPRTIEYWLKNFGFPQPLRMESSNTRYWRPDHLMGWVKEKEDEARAMLNLDQVCARVGVHPETWHSWVKQGKAPASVSVELGSGRDVWRTAEIDEWLQEKTGGYPLPNVRDYTAAANARKTARRGPKRIGAGGS